MTLSFGRFQKVAFRTDVAFQRHDDFFTRTVDRRVGHLRKQLLEVIIDQAWLITHTGQSRIITHGPDRILLGGNHRNEHELQRFRGVPERLHMLQQFVVHHSFRCFDFWKFAEQQTLVLQPLLVRTSIGEVLLQFFVRDHASLLEVDQEHLARLQSSLDLYVSGINIEHPDFARHDHSIIVRDVVATGTQAVAVKRRTDDGTVCK